MNSDKEYLDKTDLRRARRKQIKEKGRQALSKAVEEAWKDLFVPTQKK